MVPWRVGSLVSVLVDDLPTGVRGLIAAAGAAHYVDHGQHDRHFDEDADHENNNLWLDAADAPRSLR
jgi:hypothetical protein